MQPNQQFSCEQIKEISYALRDQLKELNHHVPLQACQESLSRSLLGLDWKQLVNQSSTSESRAFKLPLRFLDDLSFTGAIKVGLFGQKFLTLNLTPQEAIPVVETSYGHVRRDGKSEILISIKFSDCGLQSRTQAWRKRDTSFDKVAKKVPSKEHFEKFLYSLDPSVRSLTILRQQIAFWYPLDGLSFSKLQKLFEKTIRFYGKVFTPIREDLKMAHHSEDSYGASFKALGDSSLIKEATDVARKTIASIESHADDLAKAEYKNQLRTTLNQITNVIEQKASINNPNDFEYRFGNPIKAIRSDLRLRGATADNPILASLEKLEMLLAGWSMPADWVPAEWHAGLNRLKDVGIRQFRQFL